MGTPRVGAVSNAINTATSVSMTHYVAPNQPNGIVFFKVTWTGTATISAITFNGVNIASNTVASATSDGTGTSTRSLQWFYIKGADIGATGDLTLAITFSASNKWHVSCVSLDNVDQTTPFGTASSEVHSGTDAAVACSPASSTGNIVLVGFSSGTGTPTKGASQYQLEQLISNDTWGATSWIESATTSTAVEYTYASSSANAMVQAFEVRGATGPAPLVAPSGNANRSVNVNSGPDNALTVGTLWKVPFGPTTEEASGTGLSTRAPFAYAATLGKYSIYVSANTCTQSSTVTVYVNGSATSITITVPASTTGAFSDVAHTASIAAGDFISHAISPGSGGGTGSITVASFALELIPDDTTKTVSYLGIYSAGDSSAINTPSNMTSYHSANGGRTVTNATESAAWMRSPIAGTIEKTYAEMYAISAGSRHALDVRLGPRINGANAACSWLQAPVTTDGWTSEHSGSDSIAVGDKVAHIVALDAGEAAAKQFGIESLVTHFVSTERYFVLSTGKANGASAIGPAVTRYLAVSGESDNKTTEGPASTTMPFKARLFRLWAEAISNTTTGGTAGETNNIHVYLRKNGARTALRLEFPRSSGSGNLYQMDCWSTVDVEPGDTVSFEVDCSEPASGSLRFTNIGVVGASIVNSSVPPRAARMTHMVVR